MSFDYNRYERYSRQILLPGFGVSTQQKLDKAKVLVVGAGGLGCPALQYLASAGVGTIGIIDDDVVTVSNLQRQVLYTEADIGFPKARKAAAVLERMNSGIGLNVYTDRLTTGNALELFANYDVILDGTDNFSTRYLINDACVLLKKPLVFGAVSQYEGQIAVFNGEKNGEQPVNYRDQFPDPPKDGEIANCADGGVLGVLPGIIGAMQANEALKLITGIGEPLVNRLLTYNALTNQTYEIILVPGDRSKYEMPANESAFRSMDYTAACASSNKDVLISASQLALLINDKNITIIDVREKGELPVLTIPHQQLPLSTLQTETPSFNGQTWVFLCQTGRRSLQAINYFSAKEGNRKMYSLDGGIMAWEKFNNRQENDKANS
jgi:molybdopterin/thiamine biosynthesis adenylyltransferase/rhodanese-related sulfurtransferase